MSTLELGYQIIREVQGLGSVYTELSIVIHWMGIHGSFYIVSLNTLYKCFKRSFMYSVLNSNKENQWDRSTCT